MRDRIRKLTAAIVLMAMCMPVCTARAADETYIVDEFNIHTPVMAPGTITDQKGDPVNKEDKGSPIPTSLVSDNSAPETSNLRLDQFYYIRWKDVSELTNARYSDRDRKHRDGQDDRNTAGTPEMGGYVHETSDGDDENGLEEDKFTKDKYMKFPFEVFYNGDFYAANQWILIERPRDLHSHDTDDHYFHGWSRPANIGANADGSLHSDNHWLYTPFYIPTWSKEGLYEEIENLDDAHRYGPSELDTCVQLRVEALNSEGTTGSGKSRAEELQEIANTYYNVDVTQYDNGAAYVATFNLAAQVSGWIYDFTITGTSDRDIFAPKTAENVTSKKVEAINDYSFTANKQDKKAGTKNRYGWPALRYAKDGKLAKNASGTAVWSDINTIALDGAWKDASGIHYGKSNTWKYMGAISRGTTYSYSMKTIANMWNFNGKDEIRITPTFTYQKYDPVAGEWKKKTHDKLKIYYSDDGEQYIPYGSDKDRAKLQQVYLGNPQFDQSYYTEEDTFGTKRFGDWINYNVYQYDKMYNLIPVTMDQSSFQTAVKAGSGTLPAAAITPQTWMTQKHDIYCMSKIIINEKLRLLSGEPDQLKVNNYKNGYDVTDTSSFKTYRSMANDYYKEITGKFVNGSYETGSAKHKMIINDTIKEVTADDKFRYSIQTWYGKYYVPSDLFVVDLEEHPEFRDFSDPASPYHAAWEANGGFVYGREMGATGDTNPYWDYLEFYATKDYQNFDGLTADEDIFLQEGFLIVNFDIIAVKNGTPHLIYHGPNGSGWKSEGYIEVPDSPDILPPEPGTTEDGVPTDPGDTVVVDLSKRFGDRYRAGLYDIN